MNRSIDWRRVSLLGVVLALVLFTPPGTRGTSPEDSGDTGPRVTGFASVPWNASRETIAQRMGPPDFSQLMDVRLGRFPYPGWRGTVLIYGGRSLLGRKTQMRFYLHDVEGLRKGEYRFYFGPDEDCRGIFERAREHVTRRYPGIKPIEKEKPPASFQSFCKAMIIGSGYRDVWWPDPGSVALVHLSMGHGRDYVLLAFEGPDWVWWRKRTIGEFIVEPQERD